MELNRRPIILDPADPTGNLGLNARWDLLAQEAAACAKALCCMGIDGAPIQPWPVRVRIWGALGRGPTVTLCLSFPACHVGSAPTGRLG